MPKRVAHTTIEILFLSVHVSTCGEVRRLLSKRFDQTTLIFNLLNPVLYFHKEKD